MAKKIWMPTLSSKGWLTDLSEIIDMALSHMFVSDYSQSNVHHRQITSFGWLVAQYGNSPATMANETEAALTSYLSRYCDRCNVVVTYDFKNGAEENNSKYNLTMRLEVYKDGERYALDRGIEIIDSKFKFITGVLNGKAAENA